MANSTVDGSVVINVNMNVSDAEKELAKLKKKIENIEAQIKKTELKRQEANQKAIFGASELDAEKAKLQEIKDRLSDIKAMAKDKSLGQNERDNVKALIASVQAEYSEQRERVRGLQTEYNKVANSVDRYDQKLKDLNNDLEVQKVAAGGMEQEIAAGNERFRQMAEEAGIADQHIIELNKELSELKSRQAELETAGIGLGYAEYDQNAALIAEITKELKEYQKALADASSAEKSAMPDNQKADRSANSQRRMNAYLEKSSSIYQKLSSMIGKTTQMSGVLQDIASTTGGKFSGAFQSASKAVDGLGTAFSGVLTKIAPVLAIASAVIAVVKKIWSAMKEFAAGFTNAIKRGAAAVYSFGTAVAKNFVSALKAIGRFSGAAAKAIFGITKKFIHFAKQFNVFSHMSEAISGTFKQLGNTIKSALVFSVIYQGLSLIRQQVGAYLSVNTELTTALRRLQGALLTAFQPIYEVVVPALTTLINILTRAAATVTQFFASLFGTTAKQAQTNAKDLYEQANATTALGEAAEEAAGSLAGFDEINQIQTENKSGGGGGSSSSDNGPLFDYEYDETPFDSWGEAFSAFLDKLLDGIPKLEDAFKKFADWLNDFSKNLYEMFTFPGVLEKVEELGRRLAEALNGLVDGINWYQLGQALGAGLNLALQFLTEFIYTFDWMNLGHRLAEFINGLASEIDWYDFGRLLWAGFKIALETLAGFILGLDMPLMAEAASSVIKGFFDEMYNTITRIPWQEIGRQIARFLNGIDWYGTITSVISAIQAALIALAAMIFGFVNELNWGTIARDIYRAINDSMGEIDWEAIGRVIGDAFIHIFDFLRDVIAGIDWYQIGEDIRNFLVGLDWRNIVESIFGAIEAAFTASSDFFSGLLGEELKRQLVDMLLTISKYTLVIGALLALSGANIPLGLGLIAVGAVSLAATVAINWDFLPNTISGITTKIATVLGGALLAIGAILTFSNANLPLGIGLMAAGAASLGTAVAINWETISSKLQGTIGKITAIVSGALLALGAVLLFTGAGIPLGLGLIAAGAAGLATTIAANWETIQPKVQTALNAIKKITSAAQLALGVVLLFTGAGIPLGLGLIGIGAAGLASVIDPNWGGILESLRGTIGDIETWWKNGPAKYFTLGYWKDKAKEIVDGFMEGLGGFFNSLKEIKNSIANAFSVPTSRSGGFGSGGSGSFGGNPRLAMAAMPDITNFEIPALARGAVIPPNREFLAVLGDQRSGNNIEAPEGLLRRIAREENGNGEVIALLQAILEATRAGKTIMVDRKVLGQTVTDEQNRRTRATGRPVVLN